MLNTNSDDLLKLPADAPRPRGINEKPPGQCWCPHCKKEGQPVGMLDVWTPHQSRYSIVIALCKACCAELRAMAEAGRKSHGDGIEKAIVDRYKHVRFSLPPGTPMSWAQPEAVCQKN